MVAALTGNPSLLKLLLFEESPSGYPSIRMSLRRRLRIVCILGFVYVESCLQAKRGAELPDSSFPSGEHAISLFSQQLQRKRV